jgi:predicted peroxiredoxin
MRMTILVASADPERLHFALSLAAAQAALDRPARLFLSAPAVRLLRPPIQWSNDAALRQAGLPTLPELLDEVLAMGVECTACQSGLALAGFTADRLPDGVTVSGLVSILSEASPDEIIVV